MVELRGADIQARLKDIDDYIRGEYLKEHPKKERDWRTYEQQFARRIYTAMKSLEPLIHEAVSTLHVEPRAGHPYSLTLEQRVKVLLIKQLVGESNRMFAGMLVVFSLLDDIDISYKTVERLYSDEEVDLALHNLHALILKGVTASDATGDGTGYSLTIKKNYESYAQELKDRAKEEGSGIRPNAHRRRLFAYTFTIMDLRTRLYLAYGSSMKSERVAFDRAVVTLSHMGVELDSMRLDRYYSAPTYVDGFGGRVYIMPKRNATLKGSQKWKDTMKEFVTNTMGYLEQYHLRSNSEAGFAADKKMLGWGVAQRREDRIYSALFCVGLWHNLFNMGR